MRHPVPHHVFLPVIVAVFVVASCTSANAPSGGYVSGDEMYQSESGTTATETVMDATLSAPAYEAIGPSCTSAHPDLVVQMQEQLNAERERLNLKPLEFVENLTFAAQAHACDMATMGRLQVAGSNGSSVVHRVRAVEYKACSSAQLTGRRNDGYSQVVKWMDSAPDREVIVHKKFDDAGIGIVRIGGTYLWSVVMADRCS